MPGETSTILFKRGTNASVIREAQEIAGVADEEKGAPELQDATESERGASSVDSAVPVMSDVFTWRHLEYDVRVGKGETRRLLEDVSGYVAPGKLTALMGESGAGKVSGLEIGQFKFRPIFFFSSDHTVECSRRAPGGWCCWR